MKTPLLSLTLALGILSAAPAGEQRIRIEMHIAPSPDAEASGGRTLFKKKEKEDAKAKAGADFAFLATAGKAFSATSFREFIAPTRFDPPEILGEPEVINREDGSILVVGNKMWTTATAIDQERASSFPVTPVNPSAFNVSSLGWEIAGTPRLSKDGLVIVEAEVKHHDARAATAHFGEGTGPIVTKATAAFGREVEVILTENKAQMASTSVTLTPLVLRARPGVTYPITVMLGDTPVPATIRCTLAEDAQ